MSGEDSLQIFIWSFGLVVALLCLTSLSTIFQLYRFIGGETGVSEKTQTCCDQFHSWKETDKTTDLP